MLFEGKAFFITSGLFTGYLNFESYCRKVKACLPKKVFFRGVQNLGCSQLCFSMEACKVVRLIVNKAIVSAEPKRRGNPGYGPFKAIRILLIARSIYHCVLNLRGILAPTYQ
jgi:hypothetical protein